MILAAGAPTGDSSTLMQLLMVAVMMVLINNFVLHYFVGICSFIGVSRRIDMAFGMGMAVTFVLVISCLLTKAVTYLVTGNVGYDGQTGVITQWMTGTTVGIDLGFLNLVVYILVIAGVVQFVEMYMRKYFPALYRAFGVYLPLITTNCCILFACVLVMTENKGFLETVVYSTSGGLGFALAISIMAGIREELDASDVPGPMKGPAITLVLAGILALAFMGFNLKPAESTGTASYPVPGQSPAAMQSAGPAQTTVGQLSGN